MRGQLTVEAPKYQLLRQRLLADYPNLDEETVADTLEGITDLHEMIAAVIRSALVDEALQAGLRFRVDDMRERLSRLEQRAAKKRLLALEAMTEVGLPSSSSQTLPPQRERGLPRSWSLLRRGFQKPSGCHSRRSSIIERSWQSLSAASRSPGRK